MTRSYTLATMGVDTTKANTLPQYIAALSVCLGAVAAGTVLGWTSTISTKLQDDHDLNDIVIDSTSFTWIGSLVNIGAMVMCMPIGYICDSVGRKLGCLLTIIPFTIGWCLIIFSANVAMICVGRFLTGLAGGAFCVAAPMYTSEIAQNEIRGALGSYFQLLLTVGILISYVGGAYMSSKALSILCAMVPLVFGVVFFFQPETPVYYLKKKEHIQALRSLQRLRGQHFNCEREMKELQDSLENDKSATVSFAEACKTPAAKKAIFITFSLMFFQQFSGVNAVIFYTRNIFDAAGSTLDSSIAAIIVGVVQTLATFISSLIIDRFGRKALLLCSIIFMVISGLLLGIFFSLHDRNLIDKDSLTDIGFLPVLSLIVFIAAFSLGIGPIPWLIGAELLPPEIKSVVSSAAGTFNWLLSFIITLGYLPLKDAINGDSVFYIFACISIVGTLFVYFQVPETKGKSVAEIQLMLSGHKSSNEKDGYDNPSFQKA